MWGWVHICGQELKILLKGHLDPKAADSLNAWVLCFIPLCLFQLLGMAEHPQRPRHCSLQSPLPFTFLPRFIKQIFVLLCVNEFYLKVAMTLQFLNPCLMDKPYSLTSSFPSLNLRACCSPVFDISRGWLSGVIQRWEMSFVLLFFFFLN